MLDGKYEITSERELGERVTRFGATAPDGTALTISWYELETPADEHAFEQYRTLLRQLRRRGHAAIFDLVSRPGAHYVAWRLPEDVGALPVMAGAEVGALEEVLSAYKRTLTEASIYAPPDASAAGLRARVCCATESSFVSGHAGLSSGDQNTSLDNPGCGCVGNGSPVVAGGRVGAFRDTFVVAQFESAVAE